MENIYNKDLIKMIFDKIPEIKILESESKLVLSHNWEDWDFICILSQRLGFVASKWMEDQQPRTTIYRRHFFKQKKPSM